MNLLKYMGPSLIDADQDSSTSQQIYDIVQDAELDPVESIVMVF